MHAMAVEEIHAIEMNTSLAQGLVRRFPDKKIINCDFLNYNPGEIYSCVLMNPPFKDGIDIKHIKHAASLLKAGGTLVAICANGPRQKAILESMASHWEELPAGSFEGTNVRTVLLTIER